MRLLWKLWMCIRVAKNQTDDIPAGSKGWETTASTPHSAGIWGVLRCAQSLYRTIPKPHSSA